MRKLASLISLTLTLFAFSFATDRVVLLEYFTNTG
jgi:hypothetical protein